MKFSLKNPFWVFGLVVLWRVLLLAFTVQPIPANDAFNYDGAVVNWLRNGHYCSPAIADLFPISGGVVFSGYPPGYQVLLLVWMAVFGTSVISAMALHLVLFVVAGLLVLKITDSFFPAAKDCGVIALLFLGITFGDRPEDLAHVLGLGAWLLVARNVAGQEGWKLKMGIALLLFSALYTSPISAAFYFGAGFLTVAAAWLKHRRWLSFIPFVAAAFLFGAVTVVIVVLKPLWWQGFMESARQQSVVTTGLHLPGGAEILKLIRTVPVFLLALGLVPVAVMRWKQPAGETWMRLTTGIFAAGWALFMVSLTLLSPHYIAYAMFAQIILAAGLFAVVEQYWPQRRRQLQIIMLSCVALVSIRAIGMTTWGVACAWKNSYGSTQIILRGELEPFTKTNTPVMVSSAFLYTALAVGVQHPIHSDWYFDHAAWTNNAEINGLIRFKPPKLVLTQFDYYRGYVSVLEQLRQHPELVTVNVRDFAGVRPPDSIPSFQRVVQHISWAPVIVDLNWK